MCERACAKCVRECLSAWVCTTKVYVGSSSTLRTLNQDLLCNIFFTDKSRLSVAGFLTICYVSLVSFNSFAGQRAFFISCENPACHEIIDSIFHQATESLIDTSQP